MVDVEPDVEPNVEMQTEANEPKAEPQDPALADWFHVEKEDTGKGKGKAVAKDDSETESETEPESDNEDTRDDNDSLDDGKDLDEEWFTVPTPIKVGPMLDHAGCVEVLMRTFRRRRQSSRLWTHRLCNPRR